MYAIYDNNIKFYHIITRSHKNVIEFYNLSENEFDFLYDKRDRSFQIHTSISI